MFHEKYCVIFSSGINKLKHGFIDIKINVVVILGTLRHSDQCNVYLLKYLSIVS